MLHITTLADINASHRFELRSPGGRLRDCIKAASYYVGSEKANITCDTTRCSSGCGSHDRTNIITTLYQVGAAAEFAAAVMGQPA